MFTLTHTLETSATPERVWALLESPTRWTVWMTGLDRVRSQSRLAFKTKGSRRFRVERQRPREELQWVLQGFLREARFTLKMVPSPMGCILVLSLTVKGAGAWMDPLFWKANLGRSLPESLRALARIAAAG